MEELSEEDFEKMSEEEILNFYKKMTTSTPEIVEKRKRMEEYKNNFPREELIERVTWEDDISKMSLKSLKSQLTDDKIESIKNSYVVEYLELDAVLDLICDDSNAVFPKDKLWETDRTESKTAEIIDLILTRQKLIPPIVDFIDNQITVIIDGNHRIALCRYLDIEIIPFILNKKFTF